MKYFETKYEKDSARITALIAVILILLIFIIGPKYLDPPEEYGIAVNFGTSAVGSGQVQPKEPVRSQPPKVQEQPKVQEEEPKVEETPPAASTPQESTEEVLTADNAEAIAMKKQKEKERKEAEAIAEKVEAERVAKEKAEAERIAKEKAEAERLEKERKEQKAKRDAVDGLLGGIKNSKGTDSGSEGDDNQAGDKGPLNGDPYAPSYFGDPGTGGGGVGYGLNGRGKPDFKRFQQDCNEYGMVVVKIEVNQQGKVIKAEPGAKGTIGDICLYEAAKKTALSHKWKPNSKAPPRQIGFVSINFTSN